MDSGIYAVCTALTARTDALDLIANNLANTSTNGFRARHASFTEVLAGTGRLLGSELNRVVNDYGLQGSSLLDSKQGSLLKTGNDLDLAIDGPAYLSVQTAGGPMYTRSGSLMVSPQGQLVTTSGDAVLGDQGVITVPLDAKITVSPDGTISADGAVTGKLKLTEFAEGTPIEGVGNTYYSAPASAAIVATRSEVRQGMVEESNVNPVASVVELINAQRSAETMRHALTMFDSEMDKTAVQDIPRIS
jgi:flagellar basal-body rod protein FlgF/flagellar basal-body rod protein FlgG